MASITLDLTLDSSKEGLEFWLNSLGHNHLKEYHHDSSNWHLEIGDALRSKEGYVARIVHVKENKLILANNKLSKDDMQTYFVRTVITKSKECPYCGNPKGSELDCPSGCFNSQL